MIPYCILVIEDDDDRAFMEQLFVEYHRLMYHEIFKLIRDQWAAEDVMQSTLVRLIDKIPELRIKDRDHLVNYIITASKNQARNYLRDSGRHSTSDLQEFIMNCRLSISSGGNASCFGDVSMSAGYDSEITLALQRSTNGRSWSNVASWSGNGSETLTKSRFVTSGYDYRCKLTVKVYNSSGEYVITYSQYSDTISY